MSAHPKINQGTLGRAMTSLSVNDLATSKRWGSRVISQIGSSLVKNTKAFIESIQSPDRLEQDEIKAIGEVFKDITDVDQARQIKQNLLYLKTMPNIQRNQAALKKIDFLITRLFDANDVIRKKMDRDYESTLPTAYSKEDIHQAYQKFQGDIPDPDTFLAIPYYSAYIPILKTILEQFDTEYSNLPIKSMLLFMMVSLQGTDLDQYENLESLFIEYLKEQVDSGNLSRNLRHKVSVSTEDQLFSLCAEFLLHMKERRAHEREAFKEIYSKEKKGDSKRELQSREDISRNVAFKPTVNRRHLMIGEILNTDANFNKRSSFESGDSSIAHIEIRDSSELIKESRAPASKKESKPKASDDPLLEPVQMIIPWLNLIEMVYKQSKPDLKEFWHTTFMETDPTTGKMTVRKLARPEGEQAFYRQAIAEIEKICLQENCSPNQAAVQFLEQQKKFTQTIFPVTFYGEKLTEIQTLNKNHFFYINVKSLMTSDDEWLKNQYKEMQKGSNDPLSKDEILSLKGQIKEKALEAEQVVNEKRELYRSVLDEFKEGFADYVATEKTVLKDKGIPFSHKKSFANFIPDFVQNHPVVQKLKEDEEFIQQALKGEEGLRAQIQKTKEEQNLHPHSIENPIDCNRLLEESQKRSERLLKHLDIIREKHTIILDFTKAVIDELKSKDADPETIYKNARTTLFDRNFICDLDLPVHFPERLEVYLDLYHQDVIAKSGGPSKPISNAEGKEEASSEEEIKLEELDLTLYADDMEIIQEENEWTF